MRSQARRPASLKRCGGNTCSSSSSRRRVCSRHCASASKRLWAERLHLSEQASHLRARIRVLKLVEKVWPDYRRRMRPSFFVAPLLVVSRTPRPSADEACARRRNLLLLFLWKRCSVVLSAAQPVTAAAIDSSQTPSEDSATAFLSTLYGLHPTDCSQTLQVFHSRES